MLKSFLFDCGAIFMQIGMGLLILILFLVASFFTVLGFFIGRTWKATKYMDELQRVHETEQVRRRIARSRETDS